MSPYCLAKAVSQLTAHCSVPSIDMLSDCTVDDGSSVATVIDDTHFLTTYFGQLRTLTLYVDGRDPVIEATQPPCQPLYAYARALTTLNLEFGDNAAPASIVAVTTRLLWLTRGLVSLSFVDRTYPLSPACLPPLERLISEAAPTLATLRLSFALAESVPPLTSLFEAACPALTHLDIGSYRSFDQVPWAAFNSRMPRLTKLDFYLTEWKVSADFLAFLQGNTTITSLPSLEYSTVMTMLAEKPQWCDLKLAILNRPLLAHQLGDIQLSKHLSSLTLQLLGASDRHCISRLASQIASLPSLTSLDLMIERSRLGFLIDIVRSSQSLLTLGLSIRSTKPHKSASSKALFEAIGLNTTIRTLNLKVWSNDQEALERALLANFVLHSVSFYTTGPFRPISPALTSLFRIETTSRMTCMLSGTTTLTPLTSQAIGLASVSLQSDLSIGPSHRAVEEDSNVFCFTGELFNAMINFKFILVLLFILSVATMVHSEEEAQEAFFGDGTGGTLPPPANCNSLEIGCPHPQPRNQRDCGFGFRFSPKDPKNTRTQASYLFNNETTSFKHISEVPQHLETQSLVKSLGPNSLTLQRDHQLYIYTSEMPQCLEILCLSSPSISTVVSLATDDVYVSAQPLSNARPQSVKSNRRISGLFPKNKPTFGHISYQLEITIACQSHIPLWPGSTNTTSTGSNVIVVVASFKSTIGDDDDDYNNGKATKKRKVNVQPHELAVSQYRAEQITIEIVGTFPTMFVQKTNLPPVSLYVHGKCLNQAGEWCTHQNLIVVVLPRPEDMDDYVLTNNIANVGIRGDVNFQGIGCQRVIRSESPCLTLVFWLYDKSSGSLHELASVQSVALVHYANTKDIPPPTITGISATVDPSIKTLTTETVARVVVEADRLKWGISNLLTMAIVSRDDYVVHKTIFQSDMQQGDQIKRQAIIDLEIKYLMGHHSIRTYYSTINAPNDLSTVPQTLHDIAQAQVGKVFLCPTADNIYDIPCLYA
eukprot:gene2284-2590_t